MSDTVQNEIDHFSNLPHIWWGAQTAAGQARYDRRFQLFKKLCKPTKHDKILEIGCGDGEFTKRLARLSSSIIAQDITPLVIKKGIKNLQRKNVKFDVGNAEEMKYKTGSFDIVCGISILHHINTKKSLKEIYRVLRNGGKIFFSEPNYLNPVIFLGLNINWLRERMEYSKDERALVRQQVVEMLREIGFKKIKVSNYDFLHPSTPQKLIEPISVVSDVLEKMPVIKEISGSLIITAEK